MISALMVGLVKVPQSEQMSTVIAHAMAPAFLLAAVAAFVTLLTGRLNGVIDRIRTINAIPDDGARAYLRTDLPRLQRRAQLLNKAIFLAVGSAICTSVLLITAFVSAFFSFRHEPGVAVMFVLALALMCGALVMLAREVRIALTDLDHHG